MCRVLALAWGLCFHGHFSQLSSWPRGFGAPLCSPCAPAVLQGREGTVAMVTPGAGASTGDLSVQNHKQWAGTGKCTRLFHMPCLQQRDSLPVLPGGGYPAVCLRIGFLLWLGISPENQRDCCCPQESCSPSGHVVWMCVLGYLDTNCELESN